MTGGILEAAQDAYNKNLIELRFVYQLWPCKKTAGKSTGPHQPYLTFDQGWKTLGKEMLTAHDEAISILVNLLCPQDFLVFVVTSFFGLRV